MTPLNCSDFFVYYRIKCILCINSVRKNYQGEIEKEEKPLKYFVPFSLLVTSKISHRIGYKFLNLQEFNNFEFIFIGNGFFFLLIVNVKCCVMFLNVCYLFIVCVRRSWKQSWIN